jgi:hypothetical protein
VVYGDVDPWSDSFPGRFIPQLLDMITAAWDKFPPPQPTELEVNITRRFRKTVRQERDVRGLPVRLERECWLDDEETAEAVGRLDLRVSHGIREEVYLAFECKRLNVRWDGKRDSLASEYVDDGMMRFVSGQYAPGGAAGGMIGYVLDGDVPHAVRCVDRRVIESHEKLRMAPPGGLRTSGIRPDSDACRESEHGLDSGPFLIHHLFLAVPAAPPVGLPTGD